MAEESLPGALSSRQARIAAVGFDYGAQPLEPVPVCNLCGHDGAVEASGRDRYGYPAVVVVCRRCGLGRLSPRMTADAYAAFYAGNYRRLVSAYHGRRIDAETLPLEQRGYALALADFLERLATSPPAAILDVGGSTGVVAGVLAARFGARATVLDPSPGELAVARAAGMEAIRGFAESFDPGGQRWDLVLLCQTIDHLLDARASLAAMRAMTAPGGRAFVDILDIGVLLERHGIGALAKVDHPSYFTRPTALALFARVGYEVVDERLTDDGHRGFALAPGAPAEPDWDELERSAATLLRTGPMPARPTT